jgi:hypothetical protein
VSSDQGGLDVIAFATGEQERVRKRPFLSLESPH